MLKSQQFLRPAIFSYVSLQDFGSATDITDKLLYRRYDLTADEISFIRLLVRPMGKGKDFKFE